jgi:hypothetical protein
MATKNLVHKKKSRQKAKNADFSEIQKPRKVYSAEQLEIPDDFYGMPIVEINYVMQSKNHRNNKRNAFNKKRENFLKHIHENNKEDLIALGLKDEQLKQMEDGKCPNGFNVHHKLPIQGGGKNDFSNFIFMPIYEHDKLHAEIIFPQIKGFPTKGGMGIKVKIPYPKEMVFNKNRDFSRPEKVFDATNYPEVTNKLVAAKLER